MVVLDNYLLLDIPPFDIKYKRWKTYGYTCAEEKDNLRDTLNEATGGYCMYCYSRINVDNKWYGNLEHAIEKNNSYKLRECIPNIGAACMRCNQSLKRVGEKKRIISAKVIDVFESNSRCSWDKRKQCTVPCAALRNLQKKYSKMKDAEIILQPMGVKGEDSNETFELRYNVFKMEFEPNTSLHSYSEKDIMFINRHIQRFKLNDPKYRTKALIDYVKNVIDGNGKLPKYEFTNLIVQIFEDKLKDKTEAERINICKKIYPIIFLNA